MAKKRNWLSFIKKLLLLQTNEHHHQTQKIKRRRWIMGKIFKKTKTLPSLPLSSPEIVQKQSKFEDHQRRSFEEDDDDDGSSKHIMVKCEVQLPEIVTNKSKIKSIDFKHENHVNNVAAIKIQTVYRGYLARKALRALKGFVRLQAIIRGRAVRRQAMTTLKCLQSIAKIQSQVCAQRCLFITPNSPNHHHLLLQDTKIHNPIPIPIPIPIPKIQSPRQRRKDCELLTKEEQIDIILKKKEAILRSKRIKAYSFNHRHSADSEDCITQGRLRHWLEQYVSDEQPKKDDNIGGKPNRLRHIDGLNIFEVTTVPRRSYQTHKKQNSCGEEGLNPISPLNLPAYMAATESAKAKTRPLNSPRLRSLHIEAYSDNDSPYKNKLFSPMSSINSEAACSGISKLSIKSSFTSSQQKSPSFKGISGPIRSHKNVK